MTDTDKATVISFLGVWMDTRGTNRHGFGILIWKHVGTQNISTQRSKLRASCRSLNASPEEGIHKNFGETGHLYHPGHQRVKSSIYDTIYFKIFIGALKTEKIPKLPQQNLIFDYYVFHGLVTLFFANNFLTQFRITMKFLHNFF